MPSKTVNPIQNATRELLAAWKSRSINRGWRYESDWLQPEAQALAAALLSGERTVAAAHYLGIARARESVGINESMQDLASAFAAAEIVASFEEIDSFVKGWIAAKALMADPACTDLESGLVTKKHFLKVLQDQIAIGDRPDGCVATLLLAETPDRWTGKADVGQVFQHHFRNTGTPVMLNRRTLSVLLPNSEDLLSPLQQCMDDLAAIGEGNFAPIVVQILPMSTSESDYANLEKAMGL